MVKKEVELVETTEKQEQEDDKERYVVYMQTRTVRIGPKLYYAEKDKKEKLPAFVAEHLSEKGVARIV